MVVLLCGFLLYRLPSSFNSIYTDYFWGGIFSDCLYYYQFHRITTVVARYPPSWLMILHRRGSWYPTVVARYPPSWLMILHRRGSWYSTVVAHDTPPSWLMILHRRGSVSTVVAHDTPPSWLMIPTVVARYPPSWLGKLYPGWYFSFIKKWQFRAPERPTSSNHTWECRHAFRLSNYEIILM